MKTNVNALKISAVNNWKNANFSLFGVINYIQKTKNDKELSAFLKEKGITRENITIDLVKAKMKVHELNKIDRKTKEIIEPKNRFSLWTILTALARS